MQTQQSTVTIRLQDGREVTGQFFPFVNQPGDAFPLIVGQTSKSAVPLWGENISNDQSAEHYKYPDVMIDIEALADTPDSAPAQIALVFFNRDDAAQQFLKYRYEPSPLSAIALGFNVTAGTLKWWDDKGMKIDVYQGETLPDVLDEMARDIARHATPDCRVWSRGNSYDLAILKLAYHRTGKPAPWEFWKERDVRTWLEGCQFKSPRKNDHDALQDAVNQAQDVIEATAAIPEPPKIEAIPDSDSHWVNFPIVREYHPDGRSKILGQLHLEKDMARSIAATALKLYQSPKLELVVALCDGGKSPEILSCFIGWDPAGPSRQNTEGPHCDPAFRRLYKALERSVKANSAEETLSSLCDSRALLDEFRPLAENPCQPTSTLA